MRDVEKGNASVIEKPITASHAYPKFCIYRVPDQLRKVNPDAYTPQALLIGPLHHSKKAEAERAEAAQVANQDFLPPIDYGKSTRQPRYRCYLQTQKLKESYLREFDMRMSGTGNTIGQLRKIIEEEEEAIRQSYAEPTDLIKSDEFVDMVLRDSIFIVELFLRHYEKREDDFLISTPLLLNAVFEDLILLENQLPYSLLEKLFEPILKTLQKKPFQLLVRTFFGTYVKITTVAKFEHFTDLFRCVKVGQIDVMHKECRRTESVTKHLHNAAKLDSVGVKFKPLHEECGLSDIKFQKGCLELPIFVVDNSAELMLRNIMALEQCRYPRDTYVCNYVKLMDFLIETNKDVDVLIEKGIVVNKKGGQKETVAKMVNELCVGVFEECSVFVGIAKKVQAHYNNPFRRSFGTLHRAYFTNVWKGTATVTAFLILILTFLQTVASFLQLQKCP